MHENAGTELHELFWFASGAPGFEMKLGPLGPCQVVGAKFNISEALIAMQANDRCTIFAGFDPPSITKLTEIAHEFQGTSKQNGEGHYPVRVVIMLMFLSQRRILREYRRCWTCDLTFILRWALELTKSRQKRRPRRLYKKVSLLLRRFYSLGY